MPCAIWNNSILSNIGASPSTGFNQELTLIPLKRI
jgi:hypothetical protein